MNLEGALGLAREGRLYPSLILDGGTTASRLAAAEALARTLLCAAPPPERPCGSCRQCRRIAFASSAEDSNVFHPDVAVLRRDLKTSTSVEATRELLRLTQQTPFEARGQVLVIAEAQSLTPEGANSLLKQLEEPPVRAPRHFLLLAPAAEELLPTLRSRSWTVWLGGAEPLPPLEIEALAGLLRIALGAFRERRAAVYLLAAAAAIEGACGWEDPRAERPWAIAAAAVLACSLETQGEERRRLLALAEALFEGPRYRLRSIPAQRVLDGLVFQHLAPLVSGPSAG